MSAAVYTRSNGRPLLAAPVLDAPRLPVLGDQPRHLRPRQTRRLAEKLPHHPLAGPVQRTAVQANQRSPDEPVRLLAAGGLELRCPAAVEEPPDLLQRAEPFGLQRHDHPPNDRPKPNPHIALDSALRRHRRWLVLRSAGVKNEMLRSGPWRLRGGRMRAERPTPLGVHLPGLGSVRTFAIKLPIGGDLLASLAPAMKIRGQIGAVSYFGSACHGS